MKRYKLPYSRTGITIREKEESQVVRFPWRPLPFRNLLMEER